MSNELARPNQNQGLSRTDSGNPNQLQQYGNRREVRDVVRKTAEQLAAEAAQGLKQAKAQEILASTGQLKSELHQDLIVDAMSRAQSLSADSLIQQMLVQDTISDVAQHKHLSDTIYDLGAKQLGEIVSRSTLPDPHEKKKGWFR